MISFVDFFVSENFRPGLHMPAEYGPNALPETVLNNPIQEAAQRDKRRPVLDLLRKNFTVPGYHSVSHLLPLDPVDLPILATPMSASAISTTDNISSNAGQTILDQQEIPSNETNVDSYSVRRVKRNWDVPFYTVGEGTVFNSDRFFEVCL